MNVQRRSLARLVIDKEEGHRRAIRLSLEANTAVRAHMLLGAGHDTEHVILPWASAFIFSRRYMPKCLPVKIMLRYSGKEGPR